MSIGIWYWVILVLWILLGGIYLARDDKRFNTAANIVLVVLLIILGVGTFGGPVK
jgi:hypothetical protein